MAPTTSRVTIAALAVLASNIAVARKRRRWTVEQLAERVGVSDATIRKIERGNQSVAIGTVFEAASLLDVPLFSTDPRRLQLEAERNADLLALLPSAVRPREVDDDF